MTNTLAYCWWEDSYCSKSFYEIVFRSVPTIKRMGYFFKVWFFVHAAYNNGATTLTITTFTVTTFTIMTLNVTTFNLTISDTQCLCRVSICSVSFMLSVIMPNVVMMNVVVPSIIQSRCDSTTFGRTTFSTMTLYSNITQTSVRVCDAPWTWYCIQETSYIFLGNCLCALSWGRSYHFRLAFVVKAPWNTSLPDI